MLEDTYTPNLGLSNEEKELITKIQNSISKGYKQIKGNYDKAVLVISKAGSGKSTLVNYLSNSKLKAVICVIKVVKLA